MRALVDSRISTRLAGSEALYTMTVLTDERTGESPCRQARPAVDDHDNVKLSEQCAVFLCQIPDIHPGDLAAAIIRM